MDAFVLQFAYWPSFSNGLSHTHRVIVGVFPTFEVAQEVAERESKKENQSAPDAMSIEGYKIGEVSIAAPAKRYIYHKTDGWIEYI